MKTQPGAEPPNGTPRIIYLSRNVTLPCLCIVYYFIATIFWFTSSHLNQWTLLVVLTFPFTRFTLFASHFSFFILFLVRILIPIFSFLYFVNRFYQKQFRLHNNNTFNIINWRRRKENVWKSKARENAKRWREGINFICF